MGSSDPTRIEKTLGRRELVITGCIGQPLLLSPSHYQCRPRRTKYYRTISHPAPVTNLNNLPTLGGAEDRDDLLLPDLPVGNLFPSTFLLAPSLSTKTNRGRQP